MGENWYTLKSASASRPAALQTLELRFAQGEIDEAEFLRRREVLKR